MTQTLFLVIVVLVFPLAARAQVGGQMHDHHAMVHSAGRMAPIQIAINPEARVSAGLVGKMPSSMPCGKPVRFPVTILNDAFVTSRLEARLVGEVPQGVSLAFHPAPLNGQLEETRFMEVTLAQPGPVDLTISFRAHNDIPDLGGRDRIHFVLRCK